MHGEHHDHTKHYVKIYFILFGLFLISVFGTLTPWFVVTLVVAFGVALLKAYFVIKHFVHLNVEKKIVWYLLGACLAFMVLFFSAVSPDVLNHEGRRWVNVAAEAEKARREAAHAAGEGAHHGDPAAHGEAAPHGEAVPHGEPAPH